MNGTGTGRKVAVALAALVALGAGGLAVGGATRSPEGRTEMSAVVPVSVEDRGPRPPAAVPTETGGASAVRASQDEQDGIASDANGWRRLGAPELESRRASPVRGFLKHRVLHFTFDDGPHIENTPRLLDSLAEHDVRATFFVVGRQLAGPRSLERRALIQRMEDEGHTVAVHTYNHPDLTTLQPQSMEEDLSRIERTIESTLGYRPGIFRPPYGRRNGQTNALLRARGYTQVLWNIPPEQGARTSADVLRNFQRTLDRMERHPRGPGGIVIMHDPNTASIEAFPPIMAELRRRNCALLEQEGAELWDVTDDLRPFLLHGDELPPQMIEQRQVEVRRAARAHCAEAGALDAG